MQWFQSLDSDLFQFINHKLVNPLFDALMPFASGNDYFRPAVVILGILLVWKGGVRGLLCILMLALIVPLGDGLCGQIKNAVGRDRPFLALRGEQMVSTLVGAVAIGGCLENRTERLRGRGPRGTGAATTGPRPGPGKLPSTPCEHR